MIAGILRLSTALGRFGLFKLACAGDGGLQVPEAPAPGESVKVQALRIFGEFPPISLIFSRHIRECVLSRGYDATAERSELATAEWVCRWPDLRTGLPRSEPETIPPEDGVRLTQAVGTYAATTQRSRCCNPRVIM